MKILRGIGLLVLLLFVVGCRVPPTKIQFNDRIARDNKQLKSAGVAFSKALGEALKSGNPGSLRSSLSQVETTLSKVKEFHNDGILPVGSSSAQAYQDAYVAFLGSQDRIVAKMREIVTAVEKGNRGQVSALQAEIGSIEMPAFEKLKNAQKAYCDEHNYKTVEKYNTD
jgi:hypothetical protein